MPTVPGDKSISALDPIPTIADADLAAIVDATDAVTKKATATQLQDYVINLGTKKITSGVGTDTIHTVLDYDNASTTKPVVKWTSTIGGLGHYHGLHLEVQESGKAAGLHTESYTAAAYNILSTRNASFDVQDFIGYLSTGQLQSGTRKAWAKQYDAATSNLIFQSINDAVLTNRFILNFSTGLLSVGTTNYETLVLADNDIPNRKFVMDAIGTVDTWDEVMHLGSSFTIANTENLSATITQNDVTNNPAALVIANTGSGNDITLPNSSYIKNGAASFADLTVAADADGYIQITPAATAVAIEVGDHVTDVHFNQATRNVNFQVWGTGATNPVFFVDAGNNNAGINTNTPDSNFALDVAGNLRTTGDFGSTSSRITKGWFTNLEITNWPSVNGTSIHFLDRVTGTPDYLKPHTTGDHLHLNDEESSLFATSEFQIFKNSAPDMSFWSASAVASEDANLNLVRSRGTVGTPLAVADNDLIGNFNWIGYDGAAFRNGAEIRGEINGTPSSGVLPCDMVFYVNAGAGVATEGMRLVKDKSLKVDKINELTAAAGVTLDSVLCKDGALVLPMNSNLGAIVIQARPDGHQNAMIIHKASSTKNSILMWYDDTLSNYTWYMGEWGGHDWTLKDRVGNNDAIIVKSNTSEVFLPAVYSDTTATSPRVLSINSTGKLGISTIATPTFGGLTVAADTDVTIELGRAKIGSPVTDIMYLSHYDTNNATDYAIKQLTSGRTCVNSKAGTQTDLCVNNVGQLTVDATKTTLTNYLNQKGIFAEIFVADASTAQSIATGAGYTKSTAFTTNGQSANATSDATNDKITITQTGRYRVSGSCSATSGKANLTWRGAAFLNGVEQSQVHWKRKMTTTTDSGDMSFTGFVDVTSVPWDLDFRLRHDDGANQNFTAEYANLNVEYMGAT